MRIFFFLGCCLDQDGLSWLRACGRLRNDGIAVMFCKMAVFVLVRERGDREVCVAGGALLRLALSFLCRWQTCAFCAFSPLFPRVCLLSLLCACAVAVVVPILSFLFPPSPFVRDVTAHAPILLSSVCARPKARQPSRAASRTTTTNGRRYRALVKKSSHLYFLRADNRSSSGSKKAFVHTNAVVRSPAGGKKLQRQR